MSIMPKKYFSSADSHRMCLACCLALAFVMTAGSTAIAQTNGVTNTSAPQQIDLVTGHNALISTASDYTKVSVAEPDVADVNTIGPRSILVLGKKPGSTQVMVWDETNRSTIYDVRVTANLTGLQQELKTVLPSANITVSDANGTMVLRGRVESTEEAKQATEIAGAYAGSTKVLNYLEISGGQQVMLQVRFAEVARSAMSQLGINAGYSDGHSSAGDNIGQIAPFSPGVPSPQNILTSTSPAVTLFGGGEVGSTAIQGFLDALHQQNLSRILADPNLVTVSGQEASFLAGGKFPVPVPQTSSGTATAITVDYQEFGVRLNFTPVVLGNGRIRMKVAPEVSDLDFANGISNQGFKIPLINSRRVDTTVELNEGQTLAIAGLLNHNSAASINSFPVIGEIPIIGALFRSVSYQRNETELLVLVTPRLVNGLNPKEVPPLPGENWRHPSEASLFVNGDLGGPVKSDDTGNVPCGFQPAPSDK
ncbi:MAG TPA: type II and III secretion system protein family protein [Tepidisphaeraceae bacterium]|jgi:pilus assembly protein CpaC